MALDAEAVKDAIAAGRVSWRLHALERMIERRIARADALAAIVDGEPIKEYLDDQPYPSALYLGWSSGRPLHVVAALDVDARRVYIITVYEPDEAHFELDLKTRRRER